jgi:hypothetical protein
MELTNKEHWMTAIGTDQPGELNDCSSSDQQIARYSTKLMKWCADTFEESDD